MEFRIDNPVGLKQKGLVLSIQIGCSKKKTVPSWLNEFVQEPAIGFKIIKQNISKL